MPLPNNRRIFDMGRAWVDQPVLEFSQPILPLGTSWPRAEAIEALQQECARLMAIEVNRQIRDMITYATSGPWRVSDPVEGEAVTVAADRPRDSLTLEHIRRIRHSLTMEPNDAGRETLRFEERHEPSVPRADVMRDESRGQYLCEECWAAMTDTHLPAEHSSTGIDMACCVVCWPAGVPRG